MSPLRSDDGNSGAWRPVGGLDEFLHLAGDFLRSQPVLHTVALRVTDELRKRGPYVYGPRSPSSVCWSGRAR